MERIRGSLSKKQKSCHVCHGTHQYPDGLFPVSLEGRVYKLEERSRFLFKQDSINTILFVLFLILIVLLWLRGMLS